ncbi:V-set domain-containing T-cell activation inhibitor 1-like, partial [Protopterus annectens]|uniref:V-set domain-containing T-cell activation inhibitor 1-like n=1 Tax=Protopterus annectens TaxID=7888 RepID=UPI001CFB604D
YRQQAAIPLTTGLLDTGQLHIGIRFQTYGQSVYLQIVPDPSSAVVGSNVTLNCIFEQSYDAKNDVILWEFMTDSKRITVWGSVPGTDKLNEQDQHFQGRTEVEFKQEKASLTLQNIRLSDSGEYRCLIFGNEESSKYLSSKLVALSIS